ncbi:MAG: thioredoxin family protein [Planctomycetaceae bacterium]
MQRFSQSVRVALWGVVAAIVLSSWPAAGRAQPTQKVESAWARVNSAFDDVMGAFLRGRGNDFAQQTGTLVAETLKDLPENADFYGLRGSIRFLVGLGPPGTDQLPLHIAVELPRHPNDLAEAEADLLKAIELAPERSHLRLQLARCYVIGNDRKSAKQAAAKGYELRLEENVRRKPDSPDMVLVALAFHAERWGDVIKLCDATSRDIHQREWRDCACYYILSQFAEGKAADAEERMKAAQHSGVLRDDFAYAIRMARARDPRISADELLALAREQANASGYAHIRDKYACLLYDQLVEREPKLAVAYHERAQARKSLGVYSSEQIAADVKTAARLGFKEVEQKPRDEQAQSRESKDETFAVTDDNFEKEVLKSQQPVLLFFWAEWAGPARMVTPAIKETAQEQTGRLRVGMVNVDDCPMVTRKYNIRSIPVLLLVVKNGEVAGQQVGALSKEKLNDFLRKHLGKDFAPRARQP